ncbi:peroxidase family protein [Haloferula sp.]|uniref:peroxidase family protein n=1 Tax=Haloferula sp. TaxID=2497595 RepID=UPI003C786EC8
MALLLRCWIWASLLLVTGPRAVAEPLDPPCPAGTPLIRLTAPAYDDSNSSPRGGGGLLSARLISNLICTQTASFPSRKALAAMVFQWGQFIDHDITLIHAGGDDLPIAVPSGDPEFDPFSTGTKLIPMTRSIGSGAPLQQINQITSLIDGSAVYGSDDSRTNALRLFSHGELRTSPGPDGELPPYNDPLEPLENANENPALDPDELFIAGDIRCNEQSGLLVMHTLFLREHNRLARRLRTTRPGLSEEDLFQLARRHLVALIQNITYREFLPAVLGENSIPDYNGYQPGVDPCISNEFATAAFRVGHSMLPSMMPRMDATNHEHAAGHLSLAAAYFVPHEVADMGITPYLRGLACIPLESTDPMVVDEVRNMLFGPPGAGGLDLAALNIQRGRDHGLGSYNQVRRGLGLIPAEDFNDISSDPRIQSALSQAYNDDVEDVDLWVGSMAEDHQPNSILGETFHWIWTDQFTRLRDGDPNWFENTNRSSPFSSEELAEIQATTLADVIARNSDWNVANSVSVFEVPAPQILSFNPNPSDGSGTLEWSSFLNAAYEIEASSDPGSPHSFKSIMHIPGEEGTTLINFTDADAIGKTRRFYRVKQR